MTVVDGPTILPEQFVGMNWEIVDRLIETNFPGGVGTLCIYLSRGCPFECTFCVESLKDRCWRPFPPDQAIEQLRIAGERYPLQAVAIGDACFGVNREWRKEFLRLLLDLKPSYWVLLETRPEFLDREDVEALAQLKTEIQFGIESCSLKMLKIMNKTKQPERFLERFRELSHQLSDLGVVHGANLIFNHPGETQETLEETFAFMDAEFDRGQSALIWSCHTYVHFPGSEIDLHQSHYEERYGSGFLSPNWWLEDVDPNISSRKVVPSDDLSGERLGLWRRMFNERRERFMNSLIPEAYIMGADNYYPDWQNDPRYLEAMRKAGHLSRE